jgi:hypothetical protein
MQRVVWCGILAAGCSGTPGAPPVTSADSSTSSAAELAQATPEPAKATEAAGCPERDARLEFARVLEDGGSLYWRAEGDGAELQCQEWKAAPGQDTGATIERTWVEDVGAGCQVSYRQGFGYLFDGVHLTLLGPHTEAIGSSEGCPHGVGGTGFGCSQTHPLEPTGCSSVTVGELKWFLSLSDCQHSSRQTPPPRPTGCE